MARRRPPDILRKSHRHVEGNVRAQAKQTLRRDIVTEVHEQNAPKALLIDLDGVVYEGDREVEGARESLAWLTQQGIERLFITNTTSQPRTALVEKLARLGITVDVTEILTPAVAAVRWLREHARGPIALFVPAATRSEFAELELAEPGEPVVAVVVGDYGEGWDFRELNRAFRLLMAQPKPALVALGMTRYWRAEDGLRLDTAPFVMALGYAAGIEPVVLGKPAAEFFNTALAGLAVEPADACIIGDDVRTDVGAAQDLGIRGILVKTGKYEPGDLALGIEPNTVLDSIAALPHCWEEHNDDTG